MKATDTILNKEQLGAINYSMPEDAKYGDVFTEIAKQQAELSFKAGIREVIEWINKSSVAMNYETRLKWQSKLKEWE